MAQPRESSSMQTLSVAPFALSAMPPAPSHGLTHAHQDDSAHHPVQPRPSQHYLSQMLPALASPSQQSTLQHPTLNSAADSSSSSASVRPSSSAAPPSNPTPRKSSSRLSHPPPAPTSSYLQQITPQSKRFRLSNDDLRSATTITPLSQSSSALNPSLALTDPLSSPSTSNDVRPLSGISRPLPAPPTPSPSQRSLRFAPQSSQNGPLIPMPQRSVEDFQKLLPQRQPAVARQPRSDAPQRSLLQAIPPQPPVPIPVCNAPATHVVDPLPPTAETLTSRRGWSLTGFRSFDRDLERIAEVVSLEQARSSGSREPISAENHGEGDDTSHATSRNGPRRKSSHSGSQDRGLPSGSILEVLGPPGSGKSSLLLQFAITERIRALGRARESLMVHEEDFNLPVDEPGSGLNGSKVHLRPIFTDLSYFSEDFWDAEIATADQVLAIDCEGAFTPENVSDAAWNAVILLWRSTREQRNASTTVQTWPAQNAVTHSSPEEQQRSEMPEEVRRLVAAILAGVHVSRVTSLASLIALLHSLRPSDACQDGPLRRNLPSSMPPRTSLVLTDSLSYFMRSSGGSGQDRKTAAQVTERIREMLLRLQRPFEYLPQSDLSVEEQEAARERSRVAAASVCTPTIVFTNQLGIKRGRNDQDASGRASPSGRAATAPGHNRRFGSGNARGEGTSMLAPLLNGQRPPQPARVREERPAPSVALCGPEMWEAEEQAAASPRRVQDLNGRGNLPTQPVTHDRGWPPSFLGQDVWRMLLFRHGTFGQRYAQMVSVPPAVQSELSGLWMQARERRRARSAAASSGAQRTSASDSADAEPDSSRQESGAQHIDAETLSSGSEKQTEEDLDQQMLDLLSQLRASLFRWRPFNVTSRGLIS